MMILHLRDENGKPVMSNGKPLTMTIAPPGTPPLPVRTSDALVWFTKKGRRARGAREEVRVEVERLADSVHGWDGFLFRGQPLSFSRSAVIAFLTQAPLARQQVADAVADIAQLGLLPDKRETR